MVEYYKRTVRPAVSDIQEGGSNNATEKVMIRNYRLHLITNEALELSGEDRLLLGPLNPGTSIYVNNSIIKPEVYKYTTSIDTEKVKQSLEGSLKPRY